MEYLLTRAELSLGLQPLPDLLDGFARLSFSFLRYVGIVEVFPELPILFEVDQNSRFVPILVNHELDALHSRTSLSPHSLADLTSSAPPSPPAIVISLALTF